MTEILIPSGPVVLAGDLEMPVDALGVVVFAHGSGSSRRSPRNMRVAEELRATGRIGTLLFDLLTPQEDATYANRFDIPLLAQRLSAATRAVRAIPEFDGLALGYFGASTGAAAALVAAAHLGEAISAVVSRGGRPDLADAATLRQVSAPTLLIVGGNDREVLGLNELALREIGAPEKHLEVVPGATHLFEEPGTIEQVSALAASWFERYLGEASRR